MTPKRKLVLASLALLAVLFLVPAEPYVSPCPKWAFCPSQYYNQSYASPTYVLLGAGAVMSRSVFVYGFVIGGFVLFST